MPIKPENKGRYPADWPEIRQRVLKRAKNRCEWCGARNYSVGQHGISGWIEQSDPCEWEGIMKMMDLAFGLVRIVLTIAHLNHIPEDCRMENLRAWCQRCHNRYDIEHRKQTRKARLKEIAK